MNKKLDTIEILLLIVALAILVSVALDSWSIRNRRKEAIRTNYITDLEIWPGTNIRPMTTNWTNLETWPITNRVRGTSR